MLKKMLDTVEADLQSLFLMLQSRMKTGFFAAEGTSLVTSERWLGKGMERVIRS